MALIDGTILHYVVEDVPNDVTAEMVAETVQQADLLFDPPTVLSQADWDDHDKARAVNAGTRDRISWTRLRSVVDVRTTVLSTIYSLFGERGEWPTYQYVDRLLDQEKGLNLVEAMRWMPGGWVLGADARRSEERVSLSVPALARTPGAEGDVERFIRFLRWAVERDSSYLPLSPTAFEPLILTSLDFRRHEETSGHVLSDLEARRLFEILQSEPQIIQEGSYDAKGQQWTIALSDDIRSYRVARTADEYLRIRASSPSRR